MLTTGGILTLLYFIVFLVLIKIAPFTMTAIVIGLYFSILVRVPEKFLVKKFKFNSTLSRIISNIFFISIVLYAFGNLIPIIIDQGKVVLENLKITSSGDLYATMPEWIVKLLEDFSQKLSSTGLSILDKVVGSAPNFIASIVIAIITAATLNGIISKVSDKFWVIFPSSERSKGVLFLKKTFRDFEVFVQGQFLVATFVGLIVGLASFVAGIKGAAFLGVLSWITDFIPYLGIVIASIPMLLIGYATRGLTGLIIGIVIIVAANQLEVWFFSPKVQSSNLKIHWYVIFVTIFIFGELFGVIGTLLALPCLIFMINYWNTFVAPELKKK
ncbi:MAG TPA: AI-2E family transporter [Petrotogaceae bacterium]|nr:AI-2E family transporter [Petrotogaceae bacterium]